MYNGDGNRSSKKKITKKMFSAFEDVIHVHMILSFVMPSQNISMVALLKMLHPQFQDNGIRFQAKQFNYKIKSN